MKGRFRRLSQLGETPPQGGMFRRRLERRNQLQHRQLFFQIALQDQNEVIGVSCVVGTAPAPEQSNDATKSFG
jgi:hypothetical protein